MGSEAYFAILEVLGEPRRILMPLKVTSVRLDDEIVHNRSGWAADIKRLRHIGDFRNWRVPASYQKSFSRLMRDLQMEVGQRS